MGKASYLATRQGPEHDVLVPAGSRKRSKRERGGVLCSTVRGWRTALHSGKLASYGTPDLFSWVCVLLQGPPHTLHCVGYAHTAAFYIHSTFYIQLLEMRRLIVPCACHMRISHVDVTLCMHALTREALVASQAAPAAPESDPP